MPKPMETWDCPDCGHLTPAKFNQCERCCAGDVEQPYADLPAGNLTNFRFATMADLERPEDTSELTDLEMWVSNHGRYSGPSGSY